MSETRLRSGMLVFPHLTQLDLTGPYEVLARLPEAETLLLWKTLDPVRSEHGLTILPMATLAWPKPRPDPRSGGLTDRLATLLPAATMSVTGRSRGSWLTRS